MEPPDIPMTRQDALSIGLLAIFIGFAFGAGFIGADHLIPDPERAPIRLEHVEVRKCAAAPRPQPNTL
ncbi:hypothetical protein JN531_003915 [Flagellatimonas centrodinii]|uniref:hypothetical protein n=1 Tax=Flagellatimonas centrodinii TaxID=2806210 RepID=UPI001FED7694|nr:hypothetical protein [Flagellatimonas centrodinii]ULQ47433.1 hypothetical protein JN531_003915 [Flagellatimonas centrodinii]